MARFYPPVGPNKPNPTVWAPLPPYNRVVHQRFVNPHAGIAQSPSIWDAIPPYEPIPQPEHPNGPLHAPHSVLPAVEVPSLRAVIVQTTLPEILILGHVPLVLAALAFIASYPVRWLGFVFDRALMLMCLRLAVVFPVGEWWLHLCGVYFGWLWSIVDDCMLGLLTPIFQVLVYSLGWPWCLLAFALGWLYYVAAFVISSSLTVAYQLVVFLVACCYYILTMPLAWLYDLVDLLMRGWLTAVCPRVQSHLSHVLSSAISSFSMWLWFYTMFVVGLVLVFAICRLAQVEMAGRMRRRPGWAASYLQGWFLISLFA